MTPIEEHRMDFLFYQQKQRALRKLERLATNGNEFAAYLFHYLRTGKWEPRILNASIKEAPRAKE